MKVDSYFKEIESLKLNLKNQRKSVYTSQQAAGGQGFTSGVYKNFNLGGQRQSGYQPGMYQSARAQPNKEDGVDDVAQKAQANNFRERFGSGLAGVKEVTQSAEISKTFGSGLLSQSMAMQKGKMAGLGVLGGNRLDNNKAEQEFSVTDGEALDTSVAHKNLVSTPSSKNEDPDLLVHEEGQE